MRFHFLFLMTFLTYAFAMPGMMGMVKNAKTSDDVTPIHDLPLPENISGYYLENGMEVMLVENPASPMVLLNLTIKAGSTMEDFKSSGMTHMLEHMLFNGTERRTQKELYDETDFYGAYSNAFTREFYTNFFFLLPSEFIEQGMDIQADMIFHSTLPPEKAEKERGIVLEEIRKDRDNPEYSVDASFRRMNFGLTGAGMPVLGTYNTIEHMSRDAIFDFYKTWYVPNNMLLTIIGNFNRNKIFEQVNRFYGSKVPGVLPEIAPVAFEVAGQDNQRFAISSKIEKAYGQFLLHVDSAADPVVCEILASELGEYLSEKVGAASLSVTFSEYDALKFFSIDFSAEDDGMLQAYAEIVSDALTEYELSFDKEIDDAKIRSIAKQYDVEFQNLLDSPHYYSMFKAPDLARGGMVEVLRKNMSMATLDADSYIQSVRENVRFKPIRENLLFPRTKQVEIEGPSADVCESSILNSGAELLSCSSDGSKMFAMHILVKNRALLEGELEGGSQILHKMLLDGTAKLDAEELETAIAKLGGTIKTSDAGFIPFDDYYNSSEWGYVRVECLSEDAVEMIKLVSEMLSNNSYTDDDYLEAIDDAVTAQQMSAMRSKSVASENFREMLYGAGHPRNRSVNGTTESLALLSPDNLREMRKKYFQPENYIISIASTLNHNYIVEIFNKLWQEEGKPKPRVVTPISPISEFREENIDLGKEQATIILGSSFPIADEDKNAFSLLLSVLSDKMVFDLRETQGLAYRLGMSVSYDGNIALLSSQIGTAPNNIETAIDGMKKYFDISALEGVDDKKLDSIVNSRKGRLMMRSLARIGKCYYLGTQEYFNGDFNKALEMPYAYDNITLTDLQRVGEKYLSLPPNHIQLIVK